MPRKEFLSDGDGRVKAVLKPWTSPKTPAKPGYVLWRVGRQDNQYFGEVKRKGLGGVLKAAFAEHMPNAELRDEGVGNNYVIIATPTRANRVALQDIIDQVEEFLST